LARADEHVWGGYDVWDRVFLWIVSSEPDRDGNVVGRLAVGYGESAMKTKQQLGSPVVVSCGEEDELWFWRGRDELNCKRRSLDGLEESGREERLRGRRLHASLSRNGRSRATRIE